MQTFDFAIIGGGVIGLTLARSLKKKYPTQSIAVLEKEPNLGAHSSGRNSGVIHAGFYYTADSLKAKFTREGNKRLHSYCKERRLKIRECGKLVVTRNEQEEADLDELYRRGEHNQVPLELISRDEAYKIEPRVKTLRRALWSPTTASIDPHEVLHALQKDCLQSGIEILFGTAYRGRDNDKIKTSKGDIAVGYTINAAGLYADRIARDFGFSKDYRILPFKGLYIYSNEPANSFKTNIYPVPNLKNPFLGVHFTVTVDGHVKIGPTAIPALWREQYGFFENFQMGEFCEVVFREMGLFFSADFDFRGLALEEIKKYSRKYMVKLASELAEGVDSKNYLKWGKPGIRAQLYNIKIKKLEMDFIFEGDKKSFHVLNAVSPGFTASMPFADYLVDRLTELAN
ncbi:MAG: L-2-hydroxyglutarate oxidase [Pseudomonadota bacterium]|nr:L-2-hydroxyglutarate oxidase [Pseudomonadota bacterium]